ncbi:SGNH/GDSL hydrolase family protein [Arsenicicoccus sp. oral taxon 190]|uniref:SGNH/GDSL hydrolase family protein n=1 Tax=Arsenicicoccus sp. oral taxon 190 TaxID=1658671 RepID=UPI00067A386B|nr:SGNH/GDSL hydrolase family protein [Arsenicicoccus sp. oral taxon 190]AKT50255.1 G-D-S-L family lipolytic protein [Arsenicicoccus sp. oral taxon 190]
MSIAHEPKAWSRYVAIGDSFTEGMSDPDPADPGRYAGWADRLAAMLAVVAAKDGRELRYANLAIRGRLLDDIVGRQLHDALALGPDLVSIVAGGNDILRPRADIDALASRLEDAVAQIRATGADVLMATPTDPSGAPLVGLTRGRVATYIAHIWSIAQRHDAYVLDQWGLTPLQDWRMWSEDRIHMTPDGHERVAAEAFRTLGFAPELAEWRTPLPPMAAPARSEQLREHAQWAREYVGPWVQRRLTGRSSGDGRLAKAPTLEVVDPRRPFAPSRH